MLIEYNNHFPYHTRRQPTSEVQHSTEFILRYDSDPKDSLILFSLQICMALMLTSAGPDCGQICIVVIFALKEAITEANSAECMRTAPLWNNEKVQLISVSHMVRDWLNPLWNNRSARVPLLEYRQLMKIALRDEGGTLFFIDCNVWFYKAAFD